MIDIKKKARFYQLFSNLPIIKSIIVRKVQMVKVGLIIQGQREKEQKFV